MKKKIFEEYSLEDKEALLMHWWYYYGKLLVNLDEITNFRKMVLDNPEQIYKCAVVSYVLGYTSQGIINSMRKNEVKKYFESVNTIWEKPEFKEISSDVENAFIDEMVSTYNKPEANVPMSEEEIVSQIVSMMKDSENITKVSADRVRDIYKRCLLSEDEVKDEMPLVDFVLGDGVKSISVFNSERVNTYREEVSSLFDRIIPDNCQAMSFLDLCTDKNGELWTGEHSTVDLLLQLGVATGDVEYLIPRNEWYSLPGGMPYVVRGKNKEDNKINNHKPHEFTKVMDDFRKNVF